MAPLATIFAVLAACANPRADQAAYAQNALIGMPEEALLSCAGVPDRSRSAGGREYFTYQVEQIDSYAYPAYGGGFYRPWYGSRFGYPPLATEIRSRYCEAPFILQGGRVRSEERRVGQEWVSTCRFRWSQVHEKKKKAS